MAPSNPRRPGDQEAQGDTPDRSRDAGKAAGHQGAGDAHGADAGAAASGGAGGVGSAAPRPNRGQDLRASPMMAHLLDALEAGTDIGHYGRLTFAMIARHFLEEHELIRLLSSQPGQDKTRVRALVLQVKEKDYNPPRRDRILQWQALQDFPICPTPDDPNGCNVYRELRFPDGIYDHIGEFWEEKAEGHEE